MKKNTNINYGGVFPCYTVWDGKYLCVGTEDHVVLSANNDYTAAVEAIAKDRAQFHGVSFPEVIRKDFVPKDCLVYNFPSLN